MSDWIIKAEGLGKKYQISHQTERHRYVALRDVIAERITGLFRYSRRPIRGEGLEEVAKQSSTEEFWALKDISFEIKQGEVVGIIGRNGAGKSTLLKILSRITEPTEGRVVLRSRVASLLEVGTGFHPELTGRENIYLNGGILGLTRASIRRKFDEIVTFAEVEKFLDTPVKRYSSGMYVRLAFAVAAHLEPDILIVDEVLAVGDMEFQKKCLGKLQSVATLEGRTVLFVSHNMVAVRGLCSRGIILDSGMLIFSGDVEQAIQQYLDKGIGEAPEKTWADPELAPGDAVLRLRALRVISNGEVTANVDIGNEVLIEVEYWVLKPSSSVTVSVHINSAGGCAFVGGNPSSTQSPGLYRTKCIIPANLLNDTVYAVSVILLTNITVYRVWENNLVTFSAYDSSRSEYLGQMIGLVRPKLSWITERIN